MMTTLEAALDQDIEAITAIYNEAIVDGSLATADLEPVSVEARRAVFEARVHPFGTFVRRDAAGNPLAWGSLAPLTIRPEQPGVAEVAVYVTASMRGRGLGTELITALAAEGRTRAFSYLYAVVYARNRASVAAFEQSGFVPQIVLPDASNRPDTGWEDVVVLMRSLRES